MAFLPAHPQASTHCLTFDKKATIPLLHMPPVPSVTKYPEAHSRIACILFRPFRDVAELRPDGQSWQQVLADCEPSSSARVTRLVENFEALGLRIAAAESDMQRRLADGVADGPALFAQDLDEEESERDLYCELQAAAEEPLSDGEEAGSGADNPLQFNPLERETTAAADIAVVASIKQAFAFIVRGSRRVGQMLRSTCSNPRPSLNRASSDILRYRESWKKDMKRQQEELLYGKPKDAGGRYDAAFLCSSNVVCVCMLLT